LPLSVSGLVFIEDSFGLAAGRRRARGVAMVTCLQGSAPWLEVA